MSVVTCQKILTHTLKDLGRVHFRQNQRDRDNDMTDEWQWQGGEIEWGTSIIDTLLLVDFVRMIFVWLIYCCAEAAFVSIYQTAQISRRP